MKYLLSPYAAAQFVTAIVSLVVTFIVWKRRKMQGGLELFVFFVAISEWTFANSMEAAAVSQELKILWSQIAYLGTQTSPVLLFLFTLRYSRKIEYFKPGLLGFLFAFPVVVIILAATNGFHHLIWSSFEPGPAGTNSIIYVHGPMFWVSIVYIFTLVAFSTTLLILSTVQSQRIYRFQNVVILAASIIPWFGTMIYLFNINPFPGLDTTSISFFFTGLLLAIGVMGGNLLNYVPVAHELLFENMDDGLIVFDEDRKIVDINPSAERMFSVKFDQLLKDKNTFMQGMWESLQTNFVRDKTCRVEMISPIDKKVWLDINISPLIGHRGKFLGWVAVLEDITWRKNTEKELQQTNQDLQNKLVEIRLLEGQLREQANRDSLTGVYNRGYLEETLAREISRAQRKNYPLGIIMVDVDKFKNINDSFGHKTGDDVIKALGKLLQSQTRLSDCVSRYGGDEFILVMPEMNAEQAFERAEYWRKECRKMNKHFAGKEIAITISIGISIFPVNGDTIDLLLSKADQALYHAKQSGRDRTCIAS